MYRNHEGYADPTAAIALSRVSRRKKKKGTEKRRNEGRQVDGRIRKPCKCNH